MPHATPLIETIVAGLGLAFIFALIAKRLGVSILAGYLLAGIAVGPYTPGFIANQELANELAEIGVILLMFGVGLHFSLKDLLSVRAIAIPGALGQITVAAGLGVLLGYWLGWPIGQGIVFGLALSVASTVVLLRALQERKIVASERGRIAVGWLIVEDIVMVLTLVLLPALAPVLGGKGAELTAASYDASSFLMTLLLTLAKIVAFFLLMLVIGRRLIPAALHYVAHTGSRELFRLAVLAIALGTAFMAANLFGVSFALGAFLAGMILSESELSQRAAAESLPLRDAFAVLFFVSVGMLFDPAILVTDPLAVAATVLIVVVGKSLAALAIVMAFGYGRKTALTIAVSLAQIGEFSFILAGLGISLGLLDERSRDLILAGAIISILVNPFMFALLDRTMAMPSNDRANDRSGDTAIDTPDSEEIDTAKTSLSGHAIVVGYGRVGRLIVADLKVRGVAVVVVEAREDVVRDLRASGIEAISRTDAAALDYAGLDRARVLFVTIGEGYEAGDFAESARKFTTSVPIVVRARTEAEAAHLASFGPGIIVVDDSDIAAAMLGKWPVQT